MNKLYWFLGAFVLGLAVLFAPTESSAAQITKEEFNDLKNDYAYKYFIQDVIELRYQEKNTVRYYVYTNVQLRRSESGSYVYIPDGYTYLKEQISYGYGTNPTEWINSSIYWSESNTSGSEKAIFERVQDFQKPPATVKGIIQTQGKLLYLTIVGNLWDGGILSQALIIFAILLGVGLVPRLVYLFLRSRR